MVYVAFMKNFHLTDSKEVMVLDSFRPTERKNVWFLLSRNNVGDSYKLMAVRLISAAWVDKRLIPTF